MTDDHLPVPMRTNEARMMQSMLDLSRDAIVVMDSVGTVVEWNQAATDLFDFDRSAAVGASLADLIIPPEYRAAHRGGLQHFAAAGEGTVVEARTLMTGQGAEGLPIELEVSVTSFVADGGSTWFTGVLRRVERPDDVELHAARSERRLASMLANIGDIVTVLGPDGEWISSSGAGSRLMGWDPGFDPEGGIFDLVHPDDVDGTLLAFAEVLDGTRGSGDPIDIRVKDVDGVYHVLETVPENMIDDPAVGGVLLTSRDVTAARSAESELQELTAQLTTLVSSLSDGVLFVDDQRRIVLVNQAFIDIFWVEQSPDELRGLAAEVLRTGPMSAFADSADAERIIEVRYEETEPTYDEVVTMLDGRMLERDSIPLLFPNTRPGHLWVYRDVTAREELARQRADLLEDSREAQLRTENQNQVLQELAEMRSQFVATVSHELRTPLTSIVSFADLLRGDLGVAGWEEQVEFVSAIERNAMRLLRLVNDLLLLRRIESGILPLEWSSGSMKTIVSGAMNALAPLAADKQQRLEQSVTDGPELCADLGRIDQVLVNLLSNAVKFTPDRGVIRLEASVKGRHWKIVVSDNGVGIPDDEKKHLFEQFYRGSNTPDRAPGTGLGLVISKAVVERHGGSININSDVGSGTAVTVMLPIGDAGGPPNG